MRRLVISVIGSLLALVLVAEPTWAAPRPRATNYLSRLVSVEPDLSGVDVSVIELGSRLRLVNRSAADVVVLGYEGEPYLRIGPSGVFENRHSTATYLNRDRNGSTPVPPDANPLAPPDWRQVSSDQEAAWYDHRVHWMGAIDPPAVRRAPGERHVITADWRVPFRSGDVEFAAVGDLLWVPGPSPAPWLLLAVVPLGAVTLLVGAALWLGRRAWWRRPLAAALALLISIDAAAALARGWASPGTAVGRLISAGSSHPWQLLAWLLGSIAIVLLIRGRRVGLYLAAAAGLGVFAFGGLSATGDLSRSQIPSALPEALARAAVASALGLGVAVVVGSLAAARDAPIATDPSAG